MIDLDSYPTIAAKYQRPQRHIGGSTGTKPDSPRLIVIHTMESGRGDGVAAANPIWQRDIGTNGTDIVSSHFAVDPNHIWRCVQDTAVAYTQSTPWNDMALSIEQAGRAAQTTDEWHDPQGASQLELVAQLVAAWSKRWGIPLRYVLADELARTWDFVSGITTHFQITLASQTAKMKLLGYKPGSHTDPGAGFPMDELVARATVLAEPSTPAKGQPNMPYCRDAQTGKFWLIYFDGNGNRVACPLDETPDPDWDEFDEVQAAFGPLVSVPHAALQRLYDKRGRPEPGTKGDPGTPGAPGKPGADSTVPGPPGELEDHKHTPGGVE